MKRIGREPRAEGSLTDRDWRRAVMAAGAIVTGTAAIFAGKADAKPLLRESTAAVPAAVASSQPSSERPPNTKPITHPAEVDGHEYVYGRDQIMQDAIKVTLAESTKGRQWSGIIILHTPTKKYAELTLSLSPHTTASCGLDSTPGFNPNINSSVKDGVIILKNPNLTVQNFKSGPRLFAYGYYGLDNPTTCFVDLKYAEDIGAITYVAEKGKPLANYRIGNAENHLPRPTVFGRGPVDGSPYKDQKPNYFLWGDSPDDAPNGYKVVTSGPKL